MGKFKPMTRHGYAKMYGLTGIMQDETDGDGNDDQEAVAANQALVEGHQANNYDMRRTHEMLQDDDFRRKMKEEGFKGVDKMVKNNMPHSGMLNALAKWGKKIGTHNGKGDFDLRDLGATFKSFTNEHRKYSDDRYQGMIDESLEDMEPKVKSADEQQKEAEELSPELEADENIVREFDSGLGIPSPYGNDEDEAADEARAEQGAYVQMGDANKVGTPEGARKAHKFLVDWKTKYDFSGKKKKTT